MQTSNLNKTQPFGNKFFFLIIIIIIVLLKYLSIFIKTNKRKRKKKTKERAKTCNDMHVLEEEGEKTKLLSPSV